MLKQILIVLIFSILTFRGMTAYADCPEGYVRVPGNRDYKIAAIGGDLVAGQGFCVMKYAASKGEHRKGVSEKELPWTGITRAEAYKACADNGPDYHLTTNAEWMVIARNIESNPANWSDIGFGLDFLILASGNSVLGTPLKPGDDDQPHFGLSSRLWKHRRIHTLSNGEIIWDISGNQWHWVDGGDVVSQKEGLFDLTDVSLTRWQDYDQILPLVRNYSEIRMRNLGKFIASKHNDQEKTFIIRGGGSKSDSAAGVFAAAVNPPLFLIADDIGFRCSVSLPLEEEL